MKKLFNFYLEDDVKKQVTQKLEDTMGKTEKGALAALIRVLLQKFMLDDDVVDLCKAVAEEYEYTQTKNKRSKM